MRKKTNKEFLKEVYDMTKDEYIFKEEYVGAKTKILVYHSKCGYEYYVQPTNFLNGNRCPKCFGNNKTHKDFILQAKELVGDEYDILGEYKRKRDKIQFKHNKCNTYFYQYPETFLIGQQCPKCGLERRSKENHYKYNPNLTVEDRKRRDLFNGDIRKWREKVFKRDNYTCQICFNSGVLNAHHIYSWNKYEPQRFDVENGVTLCVSCHKKFHSIYGYGDNNEEQFYEFKNSQYTNTEVITDLKNP